MSAIKIKHIYEPPEATDGLRILVDRVWPRGVSKQKAALDHWLKEIGPSTALRKWFGHKPERWSEFRKRYKKELTANPAMKDLRVLAKAENVTLLFGAFWHQQSMAQKLVVFVAMMAAASASYYFIESPFVAIRRRYGAKEVEAPG